MCVRRTLVVIVLGLVLCTPAEARTRQSWARQANAICAREYTKIDAAVNDATRNPPTTVAAWARWVDRMLAPMNRMRRDLAALQTPEPDRRSIGRALSLLDRAISEVRLARKAMAARDFNAYTRHMQRGTAAGRQADAIFTHLGAKACASTS
jgi:hypothetical protein